MASLGRGARRPIYILTALFLFVYLTWRLFPSLPFGHSFAAESLGTPLGLLAVFAAARASRRSADSPALRHAWLWIALALAGQAGGDLFELTSEAVGAELSYPSPADALYLSFYPLMLVGILSFPTARRIGERALELALDCAIVGLGGGAAISYLVLGPQVLEGTTLLEAAVTIAYPVGDMILIVALAAVVMSNPIPAVRAILRWMTAAIGMFILGDLIFGYLILHGTYQGTSLLNISYQVAFVCFVVAATRRPDAAAADAASRRPHEAGRSWLPYVAIAAAIGVLIRTEIGESFFPGVAVTVMTAAVLVLVVVRQLVSLVELRQSRARLAEAQSLAQLGSWDWDLELDQIQLSDEGARLLGIEVGSTMDFAQVDALVHPDDRINLERVIKVAIEDQRPYTLELRFVRPDGETHTFLCRGEVNVKDGVAVRLHGTHQDITDRKRMEAQLEYQAVHDPLTGLFNRRQFADELERALRFANRYGRAGAVLMIDIDDFKLVNDTHGHAFGDQMLKSVAAAIAGRARETDVVARLGGDEFTVVLPEAEIGEARKAAEDIRRAVGQSSSPNLSIGIAPFDGNAELVADDVLVAADMALYEAKHGGKNRVSVYTGDAKGAMSWVERIRAALDEDRLILYSQPMIDIESGEVSHRELLIRMVGDNGEVIPPSAFLPTAERVGLITEIDRWVTKEGLRLAKGGERVSINLAGPSIGDPEVMGMVRAAIAEGVEPAHLIFEITETAAMTNMEAARDFVGTLNEFGCGVALDDFGTGFGSFTYLKHLPTSYLKIDTEFVRDIIANSTDREVVKSITDVAHSLGKRTVAEGVENKETLEVLRAYGVDCAQGWFVGPPEPIVAARSEGARSAKP
ncbi:MAG: EAL domain-containing protein [Thermoleophilia bacterium]|nr:EAL domain-containing protein [Thermoleophilia bacterium]